MAYITLTGLGHSSDDHQPMIQRALDAVAADGGGVVYIPDGTHYLGPANGADPPSFGAYSLKLGDNVHLKLGPSTTLIRRFNEAGEGDATIRNANHETGNIHVRVSGGIIKTVSSQNVGKHMAFIKTRYVRVDGVRFMGIFGDWNTSFRDCQDVTVSDVFMDSGTTNGEDGLHFVGGRRIVITNCNITCGDDCLALACENVGELMALLDVVVSNCYFWSRAANAVRILVTAAGHTDRAVRRVSISNIVAKCGDDTLSSTAASLAIEDLSNSGRVSDINIDGLLMDLSQNNLEAAKIQNVNRLRLHRVVCMYPNYRMDIDGCEDVELNDCIIAFPRGAGSQCLRVGFAGDSTRVRLLGGAYRGALQHGVVFGSATNSCDYFLVSGVEISEATDVGLVVRQGQYGLVYGNQLFDNAYGLTDDAASRNCVYLGNSIFNNSAQQTIISGVEPELIRNVTLPTLAITDTGGFRQTIDGWTATVNNATQAQAEMDRSEGRFRAPRPGSVTGITLATSLVRTAGSMTATVFKNTGATGGAGATILFSLAITSATTRVYAVQPMDSANATFLPGDELFIKLQSVGWAPTPIVVYAGIEIET